MDLGTGRATRKPFVWVIHSFIHSFHLIQAARPIKQQEKVIT